MLGALDDNSKTERLAALDVERRLAAVAFADVAGFSALVARDDVGTTIRWKSLRHNFLEPKVAEYGGRLVREKGDELFVEFSSAVAAVRWAHDVQRGIAESQNGDDHLPPLLLRIGINVEDVIVDGNELHGDGVNIAARIQQLGKPGDTLVTAAVYEYVWNKISIELTDLGEHELKNIRRPVRVYRLGQAEAGGHTGTAPAPYLGWSNRPWIAVLPFRNLSGDPKEDYFGEGITEDIVTALSRGRSLYVIARDSTLRYRDQRSDPREIANQLGVRYIVEGSVRRVDSRLRISAELIDAPRLRTIWAERYDGATDDLFEFQDRIAANVVATIEPQVYEAESERVRTKPTASLDAYDCLLRALPLLHAFHAESRQEAAAYIDRAIELDPNYARAHAYKAWLHVLNVGEAGSKNILEDAAQARAHVQRAMDADLKDAFVLAVAAHVHAFLHKELELAVQLYDRALELNENSAFAWGMSGITYGYLGEGEKALERFRRAWRLSPFDPFSYFYLVGAGMAEFVSGRFDGAVVWLRKTLRVNPRFLPGHRHLVTALANAGRLSEARDAAKELLALEPGFSVLTLASWYPLRRAENLERYVAGLREAGLPD